MQSLDHAFPASRSIALEDFPVGVKLAPVGPQSLLGEGFLVVDAVIIRNV